MNVGAPERAELPIPAEGAFLAVDKPRGPSSHQVTAWVRDMLDVPKAGHAGTLDPGVSGLLVIAVGRALPLLPLVLTFPKRYIALVEFHSDIDPRVLPRLLKEFEGEIYQTPPVRSAVRRDRRMRKIHSLKLIEIMDRSVLLDITCESGTYVRTLAVDLGEALGTGAHMGELRRVSTGPFDESKIVSMTDLSDAVALAKEGDTAPLKALLHSPTEVWGAVPALSIKDTAIDAIAHGADLAAAGVSAIPKPFGQGDLVVLVSRKGELVAMGRSLFDSTEMKRVKKGIVVDASRVFMAPGAYPSSWGHGKAARKGE